MVLRKRYSKPQEEKRSPLTSFAEVLIPRFPDLKKKLFLADVDQSPTQFLERVVLSTFFLSIGLLLVTAVFLWPGEITLTYVLLLLISIVVYPVLLFNYLMLYPDALIIKRQRKIDYELVFAGRHIVIALKSGLPLFDSLVGITKGYGEVSIEFNKIVEKVTLGTPVSQAIREIAQNNPSKYFVRVVMQIANSLATGADVGNSMEAVLDQIAEEQKIQLKEYGQKLTPFVMFFMIFGIIMPSIGVVLLTVLFSVVSAGVVGLTSYILFLVLGLILVVQFLFLGMIESSRPKYLI